MKGHYETGKPTPAAMAAATRITDEIYHDVTALAYFLDGIADEARINERRRIFNMSFTEIMSEAWKARAIRKKLENTHS